MKYRSFEYIEIPLEHQEKFSAKVSGYFTIQSRCYPSERLFTLLNEIAGRGCAGLWWTADEAIDALHRCDDNWAWCPSGSMDSSLWDLEQTNRMTHMMIFFKDPKHAMLFKLAWIA